MKIYVINCLAIPPLPEKNPVGKTINYKLLFIIIIAFISCNQKPSSSVTEIKPSDYEQAILKAKEETESRLDTIGALVTTIELRLKPTKEDLEVFKDGIIPWISLEKTDEEISKLIDADKIVLPYTKATLIVDYPLNKPASFELLTSGNGFTKKQLIEEISKRYHLIYKEEEVTASTKTIPLEKREGLINRNETNGKYGVWGHDLSDLDLSGIEVYKNAEGKIYLVLLIES
ncbi:hypothetical protein HB364_25870 [Pseudoflavitalea sp. X16]|uniref:hypothetical protein n=1 Tax=Paraflavitalea devenefica TaxID=2716334 RepID=UPI001422D392|nr:hypothetical protein [Paraflavitalea devenefica]NII28538.1 hypothetical protein [Paraflavitalea devenefica]